MTSASLAHFVGRTRELALLGEAWHDARRGRGSVCALVGEPGIGKTWLAERICREALDSGGDVAWGRCWDGPGTRAYWPWLEALRGLGTSPLDVTFDNAEDGDEARFDRFESVVRELRRSAEERALVVVLDDMHWADSSSALLASFVARALRGMAALGYGVLTNVFPWLLMFPAMGLGIMGLAAPPELMLLRSSFLNHVLYGIGIGLVFTLAKQAQQGITVA